MINLVRFFKDALFLRHIMQFVRINYVIKSHKIINKKTEHIDKTNLTD